MEDSIFERRRAAAGRKFGQWTVVAYDHTEGKRRYVRARCSCGTEKVVLEANLRRGLSKSCGCRQKDYLEDIRGRYPGKKEVESLIGQGMTRKQIAAHFGFSLVKAIAVLRHHGLRTKASECYGRDLTGQVFGKLTATRFADRDGGGRARWMFRCQCGREVEADQHMVMNGRMISCGKSGCRHKPKIDKWAMAYIGKTFGWYTVVDIRKVEDATDYHMICRCRCGKVKTVRLAHLKTGDTVSCGCFSREQTSIRQSDPHNEKFPWKRNRFYYIDNDGGICWVRSSYEALYANYLLDKGIEFVYEPGTLKISSTRRYLPDFYMPATDSYVELKGAEFGKSCMRQKENIAILIERGYKIVVMRWKEIKAECGLCYAYPGRYSEVAKRYGMSAEDFIAGKFYENQNGKR